MYDEKLNNVCQSDSNTGGFLFVCLFNCSRNKINLFGSHFYWIDCDSQHSAVCTFGALPSPNKSRKVTQIGHKVLVIQSMWRGARKRGRGGNVEVKSVVSQKYFTIYVWFSIPNGIDAIVKVINFVRMLKNHIFASQIGDLSFLSRNWWELLISSRGARFIAMRSPHELTAPRNHGSISAKWNKESERNIPVERLIFHEWLIRASSCSAPSSSWVEYFNGKPFSMPIIALCSYCSPVKWCRKRQLGNCAPGYK